MVLRLLRHQGSQRAWLPQGWLSAWFAEIEPLPSAMLEHHYPKTPNHGNMMALPASILACEIGRA